ncbi:venom protease isoform X2 [Solenopsis invicta]|uniref:venom protease isoform X2 n=1 Tax=Solenopsis invicta TaxID=13686 RepID=UPI00193E2B05|nr:venom protease isoform X2 [Solenopsis invicta]
MASIVSSLLLLVSILWATYGQEISESCVVNNSAGVCRLLDDCLQVYQELSAGKIPIQCGFLGSTPIVCCPQPELTKQTNISQTLALKSRGSVARAKCAENAAAVSGFKQEPMPYLRNSLLAQISRHIVIGGTPAQPTEFPHMAAVGFGDRNNIQWFCGGSLISAKIVLTAAHCIWTSEFGNANWVRLGDLNLVQTNDSAMPQTIAIAERIRHPDYKRPLLYHDIAILRLKEKANYTVYVKPACLPVIWPDMGQNDQAVATGWGQVGEDEKSSDQLLKVTVKFVSHASCNESYCDGSSSVELPLGINNDWQICAGEEKKDTCLVTRLHQKLHVLSFSIKFLF